MFKIDLHMHTTASDGALSSKEIINLAIQKDMKAIAITDHNSISGIKEALEYSKDKDIEVVPGIEIRCKFEDCPEVHIIGLFIDYKNEVLLDLLNQKNISIKQVIEIIKNTGGISILAHPGVYLNKSEKIINEFILFGGQGIEVNYPYDKVYGLNRELSDLRNIGFKKIAKERNLLSSGGSDFHGSGRDSEIGEQGINDEEFIKLKQNIQLK